MRTHSEGKPSAPQNRGTETLVNNASGRNGERPGSGQGSPNRISAPGPARLWALSPLGRLGVRYMPMPDRLIRTLTGGELALLTVIGSTWRPRGRGLKFSAREVGEALGWCSRTLYSHLAVLRDRGLVHGERMEITEKAHPEKGERFGKLFAWIACQPGVTSEPFRTYARSTVHTDKQAPTSGVVEVDRAALRPFEAVHHGPREGAQGGGSSASYKGFQGWPYKNLYVSQEQGATAIRKDKIKREGVVSRQVFNSTTAGTDERGGV